LIPIINTQKKSSASFKEYSDSSSHKIHAKEHDYLYIKASQIPSAGNGLYTAIPIYKDEVISIFKGKVLSALEAERRATKGDDAYFINLPDGTIMDSLTVNGFAKYANDALGSVESAHKNNSKIALDENGKVCLIATRKITVGAEIFCGYGKKYWKNIRLKNGN
jgi:hypothetical protein